MQRKSILLVVFAVLLAVTAAASVYFQQGQESAAPAPEMVSIVVVSNDVGRGTTLTPQLLALRSWPKDNIPDEAVSQLDKVIGRTVTVSLARNEPVLENRLTAEGSGFGMPSMIRQGMRAVSIQTPNIATGVAGFVLPGNKVDVLLTIPSQGIDDGSGGGTTVTLLQNVEVLAVDQTIEAPSSHKMDPRELRSVTLLVSPGDAAKLDLGQNKGIMRLSLRNPLDDQIESVPNATMKILKREGGEPSEGGTGSIARRKRKAAITRVVTLRGPEVGVTTFQKPRPEQNAVPAEEPDAIGEIAHGNGSQP